MPEKKPQIIPPARCIELATTQIIIGKRDLFNCHTNFP